MYQVAINEKNVFNIRKQAIISLGIVLNPNNKIVFYLSNLLYLDNELSYFVLNSLYKIFYSNNKFFKKDIENLSKTILNLIYSSNKISNLKKAILVLDRINSNNRWFKSILYNFDIFSIDEKKTFIKYMFLLKDDEYYSLLIDLLNNQTDNIKYFIYSNIEFNKIYNKNLYDFKSFIIEDFFTISDVNLQIYIIDFIKNNFYSDTFSGISDNYKTLDDGDSQNSFDIVKIIKKI